ncbi:MAG: prepilin-type N-terminal cleavage/methylation domain-containing protein [Candidatus Paceibacterota bacterium]|jgi:prepilin-type N-terminal cleavage/methylation domain-containing protein
MKKYFFKNKNKNKGFTIIETMIAVALFLIIVMIGMGALLNASLIHKKSQDTRSLMDNLSFVMEDISRNIRTGYDYNCISTTFDFYDLNTPRNCSNNNGLGISFTHIDNLTQEEEQWIYYIENGEIWKSIREIVNNQKPNGKPINAVSLTPSGPNSRIEIKSASGFSVLGANSGDVQQPFVVIRLVGETLYKEINTPFYLETAMSQRLLKNNIVE